MVPVNSSDPFYFGKWTLNNNDRDKTILELKLKFILPCLTNMFNTYRNLNVNSVINLLLLNHKTKFIKIASGLVDWLFALVDNFLSYYLAAKKKKFLTKFY